MFVLHLECITGSRERLRVTLGAGDGVPASGGHAALRVRGGRVRGARAVARRATRERAGEAAEGQPLVPSARRTVRRALPRPPVRRAPP